MALEGCRGDCRECDLAALVLKVALPALLPGGRLALVFPDFDHLEAVFPARRVEGLELGRPLECREAESQVVCPANRAAAWASVAAWPWAA